MTPTDQTIPQTISVASISFGERGRTTYPNIEELGQSILDVGLIQPIVVAPTGDNTYLLLAGGRRLTALKSLGVTTLHHATTSDPDRPGFIFANEGSPLDHLLVEIAENLDRENLDWRDETKLIVKAYRLAQRDANTRGEEVLMRDFGRTLGVTYSNLQAAVAIHDDLIANPDRYKEVTGVRAAAQLLLKQNANEIIKLAAQKSLTQVATVPDAPSVKAQPEPQRVAIADPDLPAPTESITIPLTRAFRNCNSINFMASCPDSCFDHIVTDPDYAISGEVLASSGGTNSSNMAAGIANADTDASLADLRRFIQQSFRLIKPQGFLVFFFDFTHSEKLMSYATEAGFLVQRWPLIWHKLDYRSNGSPQSNFCKNTEFALVCRKPSTTLTRPQMTSIYSCATGTITRDMAHPFAKPLDLWKWIYAAVAIKGQTVFDPFCGSGSASIAALQWGLKPLGCELQQQHYHGLLLNLQAEYRKLLGPTVKFS